MQSADAGARHHFGDLSEIAQAPEPFDRLSISASDRFVLATPMPGCLELAALCIRRPTA
jgi:hypothetical protein